MPKPLDIIVAIDAANGIGKAGAIPWHIPADLKRFSELTKTTLEPTRKNAVIMGRKTWISLPERYRPLPLRRNIVLSLAHSSFLGADVVTSFSSAIVLAERDDDVERMFAIGGAEVYRWAMPHAERIYMTRVHGHFDCDVKFPSMNKDFALLSSEFTQTTADGISFNYDTYQRKQ